MKLGFLTADYHDIAKAKRLGFASIELRSDALGDATRGNLDEVGYQGGVAIEHEDPIYGGTRFDEGLTRGWAVLNPLINPHEGP